MTMTAGAAFYFVADSSYFLGAVGLVNSLRVHGHREPLFALDCGLTAAQRALLEPEATIVTAPDDSPPWLLKVVAPLRHPAEVMVLIDADIVVTRSLRDLIERAKKPGVIAFENDTDRFVPEWGRLLGLGEVRRQPYLTSGFVFLGDPTGREVLSLMAELQDHVDFDRTFWRAREPDYPFLYGDQDVFNAILASRVPSERVVSLPNRLAPNPPFRGLHPLGKDGLRWAYDDGLEPYAVHHHTAKPWLEPTYDGVYSRLLRRLLAGAEMPVKVPRRQIPLRMRSGLVAYAERKRINARERWRWRVAGK
jgi:hypothetical protein